MDKKHNIRNMSVIAHVDHVRTPAERRARVSGVDCAGASIALSEPPSTGFGFAGGEKDARRVRVEDACRRPGRLGSVAGAAGHGADASRPPPHPVPPPSARTPARRELPPHAPHVGSSPVQRQRPGACSDFFSLKSRGLFRFTKNNDRALTPRSLRMHSSRLHTPPFFDVTGQVHSHGLPRRRRGYHRAGERGRRAPDGYSSG